MKKTTIGVIDAITVKMVAPKHLEKMEAVQYRITPISIIPITGPMEARPIKPNPSPSLERPPRTEVKPRPRARITALSPARGYTAGIKSHRNKLLRSKEGNMMMAA
jgi:hypothetical protein